jgi:hypothetical protein
MAVTKPTLYLLCGRASATKLALVESVKEEFAASVEVILFEIITAGMSVELQPENPQPTFLG